MLCSMVRALHMCFRLFACACHIFRFPVFSCVHAVCAWYVAILAAVSECARYSHALTYALTDRSARFTGTSERISHFPGLLFPDALASALNALWGHSASTNFGCVNTIRKHECVQVARKLVANVVRAQFVNCFGWRCESRLPSRAVHMSKPATCRAGGLRVASAVSEPRTTRRVA